MDHAGGCDSKGACVWSGGQRRGTTQKKLPEAIRPAIRGASVLSLEAPVARVCGADTPFPLAMEKLYLPDELKVYDAIKKAVDF